MTTKNGTEKKTCNQRNKKDAAWLGKVRGLFPISEDRLKNEQHQWGLVAVSSTRTPDELLTTRCSYKR
jgi:hypothetical protein